MTIVDYVELIFTNYGYDSLRYQILNKQIVAHEVIVSCSLNTFDVCLHCLTILDLFRSPFFSVLNIIQNVDDFFYPYDYLNVF